MFIRSMFILMKEPFAMSWQDVISLPASTYIILCEEANEFAKEMKKEQKKKR